MPPPSYLPPFGYFSSSVASVTCLTTSVLSPPQPTISSLCSQHNSQVVLILPQKCALPPINRSQLIEPDDVKAKCFYLINDKKNYKILAQDTFFGKNVMAACTVKGIKQYHPIPPIELAVSVQ